MKKSPWEEVVKPNSTFVMVTSGIEDVALAVIPIVVGAMKLEPGAGEVIAMYGGVPCWGF